MVCALNKLMYAPIALATRHDAIVQQGNACVIWYVDCFRRIIFFVWKVVILINNLKKYYYFGIIFENGGYLKKNSN